MEAQSKARQAEMEAQSTAHQAEEEARQAEVVTLMKILQIEKERAAARAKLKVYEQAMQEGTDSDCSISIEVEDPMERTSQYMLRHNVCNDPEPSSALPTNNAVLTHHTETPELQKSAPPPQYNTGASTVLLMNSTKAPRLQRPTPPPRHNAGASTVLPMNSTKIPSLQRPTPLPCHNTGVPTLQTASPLTNDNVTSSNNQQLNRQPAHALGTTPQLNALATSFYPSTPHPYSPENLHTQGAPQVSLPSRNEGSDRSDHANYMIRRELLNSSLSKFNDHPETYRSWKATFKAAIADLNFNTREELDLLIKWLGPGPADRVQGLRIVHVDSPDAGLTAAWARPEQTHRSPEALENALFERLQNFLKIGDKDNYKLQKLSDLLMEIELAKTDPRLTGLTYLDSSHGVNPVVSKLPYGLQVDWTRHSSDYKLCYNVSFPPILIFLQVHQTPRLDEK
ncbi:uncharacterized protein M6D78_001413 [Vipera latastei]